MDAMNEDAVLGRLLRRMIVEEHRVSIDDDGGWVLDAYVQLTDQERAVVLRARAESDQPSWLDAEPRYVPNELGEPVYIPKLL